MIVILMDRVEKALAVSTFLNIILNIFYCQHWGCNKDVEDIIDMNFE